MHLPAVASVTLLNPSWHRLLGALLLWLLALPALSQEHTLQLQLPDGEHRSFSAAQLAQLPQHTLQTHTTWTVGVQTFEGVLLRDLLLAVGLTPEAARQRTLQAYALNDYRVDIPARDAWQYDVVVAHQQNGRPLTRRDKGPFWIVYPRDRHPELNDSRMDHRWIWQLRELRLP